MVGWGGVGWGTPVSSDGDGVEEARVEADHCV